MAQDGLPLSRPDVAHPVGALPEHGHEVALAPHVGHDERQAHGPAGPPARHLQGDEVVRADPARGERSGEPVGEVRDPIGASAAVQPLPQFHC